MHTPITVSASELQAIAAEEITDAQIVDLRKEARLAGDDAQARLCTLALHGDEEALASVEKTIRDARRLALAD